MATDDDVRFFGVLILGSLSILSMIAIICWTKHVPQYVFKTCQSYFLNLENPAPGSMETSTRRPQHDEEAVNDDEEQGQVEEAVEIFLAEVRRNGQTHLAPLPTMLAREEFILNLLITKIAGLDTRIGHQAEEVFVLKQKAEGISDGRKEEEDQCAICLVAYEPGDRISFSHHHSCNHHFHQTCILHWLLQNRDDCPCCRSNYLALSDDDDDNSNDNNNDEYDDLSQADDEEENTHFENSESSRFSERDAFPSRSASNGDPWLPSYYAPFNTRTNNHNDMQSPLTLTPFQSSLRAVVDVQIGQRNDDHGSHISLEESHTSEPSNPDAWSLPSLDAADNEVSPLEFYPRVRRRALRRILHRIPHIASNASADEQTQSLELGDLIIEGLMERLQDRAEEQSTTSGSSNSVYLEGQGARENVNELGNPSQSRNDEVCAICCQEYAVNEELCWSQDPMCTHVFHRRCMQSWILDNNDYCPFCKPHLRERKEEEVAAAVAYSHRLAHNVTSEAQSSSASEQPVDDTSMTSERSLFDDYEASIHGVLNVDIHV